MQVSSRAALYPAMQATTKAMLAMGLLALAVPFGAQASPIIGAVGVTTTMGAFSSASMPISRVIDQSGLSQSYTSGVTDFDTFTASATHVGISDGTRSWFSALNNKTGTVTFDLGTAVNIDAFGLWNLHLTNTNSIKDFRLFDDGNNLLGSYTAVKGPGPDSNTITAQVFSFAATQTQHIRMEIDSNHGGSLTGFGEAVFRNATTVPEPTTLALLAAGAVGLARRRRAAPAAA